MSPDDTLYGRIRNGVLTLSGNNPSVKVSNGYLVVSDGPEAVPPDHRGAAPPVKDRMATVRLPRAGCPVNRIVVTRPDGFITFGAIQWLRGVGCALMQLDWDGTVLLATAPAGPDRAAIRRAQALAAGDESGLAIMREILRCKLAGQARVARLLGGEDTATLIDRLTGEITNTQEGIQILGIEGAAAAAYWTLWADLPVQFARRDRVPEHWQTFGFRRPEGSRRQRKATTAGVALLNYLYGVLAGELTIALLGAGLDPGIGIFHADKEGRASLTYDAMEAARPYVDAWLAACFDGCRFAKHDFYEDAGGTIRITRPLAGYLAMTAPLWRRAAEAVAGWLADSFARFARRQGLRGVDDDVIDAAARGEPLPARGAARTLPAPVAAGELSVPSVPTLLPALPSPGRSWSPAPAHDVMPRACHECGQALAPGRGRFCSASCAGAYRAEMRRLVPIAEEGALSPTVEAIRASDETRRSRLRRSAAARRLWDEAHAQAQAGGPRQAAAAARERFRRWYVAEVQPRLARLQPKEVVQAIDVSRVYARRVIRGEAVPHPRHFAALALLVKVTVPERLTRDG